ncbi:fimbrial protein [Hafnia alvei]|uniref:fimbrial protein n=1 Tax=Hafnia alvei TaxID=569 RepID=UPI001033A82D|nr:fimbrial protein [Hafnia alvei]TBL92925.1 type 1 fimbrial protein [Hafnia alvei]
MKNLYLIKRPLYIGKLFNIFRPILSSIILLNSFNIGVVSAAHNVTVNITGKITNATCYVSSDSINKSVYLGRHPREILSTSGQSSPAVDFTINLENCGTIDRGVQVAFTGTPDPIMPDHFATSSPGIAINLMDDAKETLSPGESTKSYQIAAGQTTKSLIFYAQMTATGENVTAGGVSSTITFDTFYP